nr:acetyltransferase [Vibrio mimicus]
MVTVVVFAFGVMRCQPLRRALYRFNVRSRQKTASNVITES